MPGGIHPPLDVVFSWPTPNYVDPVRRGWGLVILTVVLFVLTVVTVCARLWARLVLQRNAGIDDAIIVACMIPTAGLAVAIALGSRLYGFDRHVWDLTPAKAVETRKITLVIESCYIASTTMTKVSILLFYRRMAAGTVSPFFHFAVRAVIAFVVAYGITFQLTLYLDCHPISALWNQVDITWLATHTEGVDYHCFNEPAAIIAAAGISIAQDFIVCGMPTILFWRLQLPVRQKIALGALFSVGFFLCLTGILRIIYIYDIYYTTYDVSWAAEPAWYWTAVEAHLAIVCASVPALKNFFNEYLEGTLSSFIQKSIPRSWHSSGRHEKSTTGSSSKYTQSTNKSGVSHPDIELGDTWPLPDREIASVYGERRPIISNPVSSKSSQQPLR